MPWRAGRSSRRRSATTSSRCCSPRARPPTTSPWPRCARSRCRPSCCTSTRRRTRGRPATDDIAVLAVRTEPLSPERLHLDLPTNPRALGTLRRTVARWLEPLGASRDESNDIQFACHEACSNAMEHGYHFREATVDVNAEFDGSEVVVTVADSGGWREQRDDDRGRGLELIRALMDSVEVEPGEDGTVVRMRKRLAEPVAVPAAGLGVAEGAS